jgi:hypothetical protein
MTSFHFVSLLNQLRAKPVKSPFLLKEVAYSNLFCFVRTVMKSYHVRALHFVYITDYFFTTKVVNKGAILFAANRHSQKNPHSVMSFSACRSNGAIMEHWVFLDCSNNCLHEQFRTSAVFLLSTVANH